MGASVSLVSLRTCVLKNINNILKKDIYHYNSNIIIEDVFDLEEIILNSDKKITMSPNELCNAFQCRLAHDCFLKFFLYPIYNKDHNKAILSKITEYNNKYELLNSQYIDYITPEQIILEPLIKIDKIKMLSIFNKFCVESLNDYPFYTISQNKNSIKESYQIIKNMLFNC